MSNFETIGYLILFPFRASWVLVKASFKMTEYSIIFLSMFFVDIFGVGVMNEKENGTCIA